MELWELAAREGARNLVASYAHLVDAGRIDEVVGLFAPNGAIEVVGGPSAEGHESLRRFFAGVGSSMRSSHVPRIRHFTSNVLIDVTDPHRAHSECYFLCITNDGLDHWGRYRDEIVQIESGWYFERRSVRTDGWVPGGWAASRRPERPETT